MPVVGINWQLRIEKFAMAQDASAPVFLAQPRSSL